ncbi:Nif3-like dinuclear metal center hexameric protein [Hydromonas duriensis]|uniref:Dinuclear metal center YbgI/SA1388 family protein n=1 Tax=Hydromonas duriensis TaxID=1527608 RepID=A0A4R6Y605_9BURK|nr:Nif3-like dinuclear metal center hexameric protein [Hydromonas duriensis]TDR30973.1 dinuclear metal center YbgI/SA1388 family protein [Hydromonas duriensis]
MECTILLKALLSEMDAVLDVASFKDYCPNGLQIQGRPSITKIATAVTASRAVIEQAAEWGADALLVHHGYFWKGEDAPIVGMKHGRIAALIKNDMSLIAYHLPLDAHPTLGNNAQLGMKLGLTATGVLSDEPLVWHGASDCVTLGELAARVEQRLGRAPQLIGDSSALVGKIAWCTGAAQDYIGSAAAAGAQTFISGEISERTFHEATELGVNYLACGHHATERYGVQALGEYLVQRFGLMHRFFDEYNPV